MPSPIEKGILYIITIVSSSSLRLYKIQYIYGDAASNSQLLLTASPYWQFFGFTNEEMTSVHKKFKSAFHLRMLNIYVLLFKGPLPRQKTLQKPVICYQAVK